MQWKDDHFQVLSKNNNNVGVVVIRTSDDTTTITSNKKRRHHNRQQQHATMVKVVLALRTSFTKVKNLMTCLLVLLQMTVLMKPTDAWIMVPTTTTHAKEVTRLGVIGTGGIFGSDKSKAQTNLPRDVKEAVSRAKEATQAALKNRVSRMDIEFPVSCCRTWLYVFFGRLIMLHPISFTVSLIFLFSFSDQVGAKFKVEPQPKGRRASTSGSSDIAGTPTLADLNRSDRELARLYVDMFAPVGLDRLTVVFRDTPLADAAKKKWKSDPTAHCRVTSVSRKKKVVTGKAGEKKGFAAKLAAEMADDGEESMAGPFKLADDTEVAIFVGPTPKELVAVERICQERGMDTLVILLNARLSTIQNFGTAAAANLFTKEFEPVFHLAAYRPQDAAPNCLLHRAYPGDWILARQPKVGAPKTFLITTERPTAEEAATAYKNLKISDVEKGVDNMVSNVAGWFK
jgi:hypothetical protein